MQMKHVSSVNRMDIKLVLTTAYNPEGNGKSECGHSLIIKALVKACKGKISDWPKLLPYVLWLDRTNHIQFTGDMMA